jgi:hypothetical protein
MTRNTLDNRQGCIVASIAGTEAGGGRRQP